MARRLPGVSRAALLVAFTCCLAVHGHRVARAQTDPSGWLDATAFAAGADGSTVPLAGVQLVLLAADGAVADTAVTDDAGNARLVDRPGVYTVVVSRDGYLGSGALTCGDSTWNADVVAADGSLSEPALTLKLGTRLCQEYLFTAAPPPAPPPPPAPSPRANPVYLTFDDGYLYLCATVALVHSLGIHATFFLTGQAILAFPGCVRQLVADGNTLGNHTYAHEDLTLLSQAGISNSLQRTEDAALLVAGVSTKPLCRPPYAKINANVRAAAAQWGCRMVLWDRDTRDWAGVPAGSIENGALSVSCRGEVILMHTQAFPRDQVALPYIVDSFRRRGCDPEALGG